MRVEPAQEEERHGKVQRHDEAPTEKKHGSSGGNREDFQRDG